jgi:hypothetical protein
MMMGNDANPIIMSSENPVPKALSVPEYFFVVHSQRLERRLEPMVKMSAEKHHADDIKCRINRALKRQGDIDSHGLFRVPKRYSTKKSFRWMTRKTKMTDPVSPMFREYQVLLPCWRLTSYLTGRARRLGNDQQKRINDVNDKGCKQEIFHGSDDDIGHKHFAIFIEFDTAVPFYTGAGCHRGVQPGRRRETSLSGPSSACGRWVE